MYQQIGVGIVWAVALTTGFFCARYPKFISTIPFRGECCIVAAKLICLRLNGNTSSIAFV
ncbi:MAG: hypothetical protein LBR36_07195 [Bacteroidales bacterium]|nr:hypothetical protein [Bacteroidales bacterium]